MEGRDARARHVREITDRHPLGKVRIDMREDLGVLAAKSTGSSTDAMVLQRPVFGVRSLSSVLDAAERFVAFFIGSRVPSIVPYFPVWALAAHLLERRCSSTNFGDNREGRSMSKIQSAQVSAPGGAFTLVESELPRPGRGQVRIAAEACGICRTDSAFINAAFPGVQFPARGGT